jgi:hypothetical protein
MSVRIEQNLANGIPQTAVTGFAPRGIAWHWTAGGTGRAGALGTIQHFINTRLTVNASYHVLFWHEHKADGTCLTVFMVIVPYTRASHSMNPANAFVAKTNSAREKARFVEVHRILARDTDPNADSISVSYCGMPANLAVDARCPVFVADVRSFADGLIARASIIDRPHFGHGWIQPISRYEMDAAPEGVDLLINRLYGEDDMQFWRPVQEDWTTDIGARFWDGAGTEKVFTTSEKVRSIAESSDGLYRLLRYPLTSSREILVAERAGLNAIAGTRVPAPGSYGFPPPETVTIVKEVIKTVEVPTGITTEDVAAAEVAAADKEQARIAAAEAARIRSI